MKTVEDRVLSAAEWLEGNLDCEPMNAHDLEIYDDRFNAETLDEEFDIYLPIKGGPASA